MIKEDRIGLMKKAVTRIIESLSFMDFLAVVYFSDEAKVMKDLNFMAPAYMAFREDFVKEVNNLAPSGRTNSPELSRRERDRTRALSDFGSVPSLSRGGLGAPRGPETETCS